MAITPSRYHRRATPELASTDTLKGNGAWNPRDRKITLNLQIKTPG